MQLGIMTRSVVLVFGLAGLLAPAAFSQNTPAQAPSVPAPANQAPSAPGPTNATPGSRPLPAAPAAPAANANPFPPPDPRNFTAETPSKATVDSFLKSSWGYDPNRIWQVQAILKTPVEGVSRIIVLVAEKGGAKEQTGQLAFFTLPDGKHIISDAVLPFGAKPFEENRQILKSATGPSKGPPNKDLEFVEFSDFECPHCKEAQPIIAKLLADYPTAHFVYENFPLVQLHSEAHKAAAYAVCVGKEGGNDAFFKFSDAVFDAQAGLTPQSSDQTLKDAATKAGQDPAKIAACSTTPETKAAIDTSLKLGEDVGVSSTPTLFVNGRGLPLGGIPYDTLRKIVDFQAEEDGVTLPQQAAQKPAPSLK
jgi:protein-disulfide isomerase